MYNMNPIEYDSNPLIEFYMINGIEFDKDVGYFGNDIKSYALLDNNKVIAAISYSIFNGVNFIEAVAVDEAYRNKGYGKFLLDFVIDKIKRPVYLISKSNEYFLKYGFIYDDLDLIDSACKSCKFYNVSCTPRVMKY